MLDYKIAVAIAMSSNGTAVLGELMRSLGLAHVRAKDLEDQLGKVRTAAIGALGVFAGAEALSGIAHIIDASKELNLQLEKTKQLGGDFATTLNQTRQAAFAATNAVPTTTAADNVRLSREIGSTLGHPDEALAIMPEAAKAAYVISHYTGEDPEAIIKNLARVADARGQIYSAGADGKEHVDPAKLQAELEAAAKGLILGGGFLKSNDLLRMAQQGGAAVKAQTPEAFYAAGVEAGVAMGASKLGTAETGLMQQFIGGTMTKAVAEALTQAGLLHEGEWHEAGGHVVVDPRSTQRLQPMMQDPLAWLSTGEGGKAIKEYAAKEGIDVMMAVFKLFGRQTVQRLASEVTSNEPQFARAREIYGQIPGVDAQYSELQAHDLETNITSVHAAWTSFMQALGDAGVPAAIVILHTLTDVLHELTAAIEAHPNAAAALLGVSAALAGLVALAGGIALVAVSITTIATALGAVIAIGAAPLTATAAAITAVAAALGYLTHGASEAERNGATAALNAQRSDARRGGDAYGQTPSDGFDAMGRPIAPTVAQPPPPPQHPAGPTEITGTLSIDDRGRGRLLARGVGSSPTTPASPDVRASPYAASSGAIP